MKRINTNTMDLEKKIRSIERMITLRYRVLDEVVNPFKIKPLDSLFSNHYKNLAKFHEVLEHYQNKGDVERLLDTFSFRHYALLNSEGFTSYCDMLMNCSEQGKYHLKPVLNILMTADYGFLPSVLKSRYDVLSSYSVNGDPTQIISFFMSLLSQNYVHEDHVVNNSMILDCYKEHPEKQKVLKLMSYIAKEKNRYKLGNIPDSFFSRIDFEDFSPGNYLTYLDKFRPSLIKSNNNLEKNLTFKDINKLVEAYDFVINHFPNKPGGGKYYRQQSGKYFVNYLNELISSNDSSIKGKKKDVFSWCQEVQRLIKSGAYDDEFKLMFDLRRSA